MIINTNCKGQCHVHVSTYAGTRRVFRCIPARDEVQSRCTNFLKSLICHGNACRDLRISKMIKISIANEVHNMR